MLLVPLVLILITITTHYTAHPRVLDLLSSASPDPHLAWSDLAGWGTHPAHVRRQDAAASEVVSTAAGTITFPSGLSISSASSTSASGTASSVAASSSSSGTPVAASGIPTIPSTAPVLPTPFPQPFDSISTEGFLTVGCMQFVVNMTLDPQFRPCRPFSLLMETSSAFIKVCILDMFLVLPPACRAAKLSSDATIMATNCSSICSEAGPE